MYQPLNAQQLLVLKKVYPVVAYHSDGGRGSNPNADRLNVNQVICKTYCCPLCQSYAFSPNTMVSIRSRATDKYLANNCTKVFFGWNEDGSVVGLFGILDDYKPTSLGDRLKNLFFYENPMVLIDEWAREGCVVPSFQERLCGSKKAYNRRWLSRCITNLSTGFCLVIVGVSIKRGNFNENLFAFFCFMALAFCIPRIYRDYKQYNLLLGTTEETAQLKPE